MRPRPAEVRIPWDASDALQDALKNGRGRESAAFGLVGHTALSDREVLLVRRVIPLPDSAYVPSPGHGAKWSGRAMIPVLNEALAAGAGLVVFHEHPHSGSVSLSIDDRDSAKTLLPVFQNLLPQRPHASVVLGHEDADGVLLPSSGGQFVRVAKVRFLGGTIRDLPDPGRGPADALGQNAAHHRQVLLIGSSGQRRLQGARVAVVGLSGGGSHVVQQLAHLGVGHITGIDGERAESSNRGRLIGMTALDAWVHRQKVRVMARVVRRIDRAVRFIPVPHSLPHEEAIAAVKASDIVIGCVDNYNARADIQDLAWRYLIPYIDIGMLIRPLGGVLTIGGHVATLVPGGPCLWCLGVVSSENLDAETAGRARSYFEGTDKQAQVVSFNGLLASQATSEALQLLTGYATRETASVFRKFNGLEGTLQVWEARKRASCTVCAKVLGAGDAVWRTA